MQIICNNKIYKKYTMNRPWTCTNKIQFGLHSILHLYIFIWVPYFVVATTFALSILKAIAVSHHRPSFSKIIIFIKYCATVRIFNLTSVLQKKKTFRLKCSRQTWRKKCGKESVVDFFIGVCWYQAALY